MIFDWLLYIIKENNDLHKSTILTTTATLTHTYDTMHVYRNRQIELLELERSTVIVHIRHYNTWFGNLSVDNK